MSTTCKPLKISFPNGKFDGQGSMFGDRYKFKCDSPFTLIGKDEVVCGEDGLWSGNVPFCQRRELKRMLMIILTAILTDLFEDIREPFIGTLNEAILRYTFELQCYSP